MDTNISDVWQFGDFRLDVRRKVLRHGETTVAMPLKELEVLSILVRNHGELVTKDELVDEIWKDSFVEESNLSRHIYLLRKTLKELGAVDELIENVPRRGYRFAGDARPVQVDEIVLERHTRTRTLIEFQDESVSTRGKLFSKTYLTGVVAMAVVLTAVLGIVLFPGLRTGNASEPIRSIAVLPFKTIGDESAGSSSGYGLADILITRLSNIHELRVRPTSSVADLASTDLRSVHEKLNVDAILEGTIVYSGGRVRVTARLIRTIDQTNIWTGEFEKLRSEELQLQNDLALQIVKSLAFNLSGAERDALAKRYTDNADAYELYTRGRYEWNKRTGPAMVEAERLFGNAVAADPNFALAYVGLADAMAMSQPRLPETTSAVARAIEIDPNLAEAHATRGFLAMFYDRDWQQAENAFKRSLELKPNYATAHHWYATLLAIRGKYGEAKAEMHHALEVDPLSYNFLADLGQIHYFAGEYAEAEKYCRRALEIYPDFAFAHQYLYYIYLKTGDHDRAIEELIRSDRIISTLDNAAASQRIALSQYEERGRKIYKEGGINAYLDYTLRESSHDPAAYYLLAIKHAIRGENEKAIEYLEKSTDTRQFLSVFLKAEPIFEGLRSESRYQQILRKMGLS